MLNHHKLVVASCLGLMLALAPARAAVNDADEGQSSQSLQLQQGLAQLDGGDAVGGEKTLRQIDAAELSMAERVRLYMALQDLQRKAGFGGEPAQMLAAAAKAHQEGKLKHAEMLYLAVQKSSRATDTQKLAAATQLSSVRRRGDQTVTEMRQLIDQATEDNKAGHHDRAEQRLRLVSDRGGELGQFDQRRLEEQLALAHERKAAQPATSTGSGPVAPVALAAASSTVTAAPRAAVAVTVTAQEDDEPAPVGDLIEQVRQIAVAEEIAKAQEAERNHEYRLAVKHYRTAVDMDPGNEQAPHRGGRRIPRR